MEMLPYEIAAENIIKFLILRSKSQVPQRVKKIIRTRSPFLVAQEIARLTWILIPFQFLFHLTAFNACHFPLFLHIFQH